MERDKIEKKVNDVLNDVLGIDYSEIKDDAVLEDDFGADSLDAVEIVMDNNWLHIVCCFMFMSISLCS